MKKGPEPQALLIIIRIIVCFCAFVYSNSGTFAASVLDKVSYLQGLVQTYGAELLALPIPSGFELWLQCGSR